MLLPPGGSTSQSCHCEIVHEYAMLLQLTLFPQIRVQWSVADLGQGVEPQLEG